MSVDSYEQTSAELEAVELLKDELALTIASVIDMAVYLKLQGTAQTALSCLDTINQPLANERRRLGELDVEMA